MPAASSSLASLASALGPADEAAGLTELAPLPVVTAVSANGQSSIMLLLATVLVD
jgi:hypothetical protein